MRKPEILKRLTSQVGSEELATKILINHGYLDKNTLELTDAGKKRDDMTPRERAVDRAMKRYGGTKFDYKYDPITNKAKKVR